MTMIALLEVTLSWLFRSFKNRDAKLFHTRTAFTSLPAYPEQAINITSPDCGTTDARLGVEYTADGAGKFPELSWTAPAEWQAKVKQWLLVSEDPDAPLPTPIAHGIFGGIPPTKTGVTASDFGIADESKALLKGGFHYGATRRGVPYIPPRPLLNHGPHRYFFFVVALSEPLDSGLLASKATREQVADAIQGKVLGWGSWVGSCERVWK
ncbi:phosphatidylethanolamine-binding protein [Xylariales sp. AK1849]|nr:phosphatidylethanolamine-binding protein [Xylariales sp. AK1849]